MNELTFRDGRQVDSQRILYTPSAFARSCLLHLLFVVLGAIATLALDKFNQKVEKPEVE